MCVVSALRREPHPCLSRAQCVGSAKAPRLAGGSCEGKPKAGIVDGPGPKGRGVDPKNTCHRSWGRALPVKEADSIPNILRNFNPL